MHPLHHQARKLFHVFAGYKVEVDKPVEVAPLAPDIRKAVPARQPLSQLSIMEIDECTLSAPHPTKLQIKHRSAGRAS